MNTHNPDSPTSPQKSSDPDSIPQNQKCLNSIETDSRRELEKQHALSGGQATNVSIETHNDLFRLFALVQLEMTYGLRINEEHAADLLKDLERYNNDLEKNAHVADRIVQIIMINMMQRGDTLHFNNLNPIVDSAITDPRLEHMSTECILHIARCSLNIFNSRGYLKPAIPEE